VLKQSDWAMAKKYGAYAQKHITGALTQLKIRA
jgi:hypothetical protein